MPIQELARLTKRQVKLLSEMWRYRYSEFGKAQEYRGKYYWGYYETYARPIGTITLDELVKLGLVEHVKFSGGCYRLKKDDNYCQFIASKYFDKDENFIDV